MNKKRLKIMGLLVVCNLLGLVLYWQLLSLNMHQLFVASGVTLIITIIEILIGELLLVHSNKELQIINERINALTDHKTAPVVLGTDASEYLPLHNSLNQLQEMVIKRQQKHAERNGEWQMLLKYLPAGVLVINSQQEVVLSNEKMAEMLGHYIADNQHHFTEDIESAELLSMINHAIQFNQDSHQLISIMARDQVWDAQVRVYRNETDLLSILVILYDITDILRAQQTQIDFLRNASHELKTPVTSIAGFSQTLLDGAKDDPEILNDFLNEINDSSQQLTELVNDILTISHVQTQQNVAKKLIDLHELVHQQLIKRQPVADKIQVKLINKVPLGFMVNANEQGLTRVIRNLVSNAVKYNRPNGSVTVNAQKTTNGWQLSVSDTGIGIKPTEQKRVFERFYRADQSHSKQEISGTGLGLAIVAEIVKTAGGTVTIGSQLDQGTTINVNIND